MRLFGVLLSMILMLPAGTGKAGQDARMRYEARFAGLRVADITIAAQENGTSYAVSALVTPTGLVALLRDIRFDMSVRGRLNHGQLLPDLYRDDVNTGRRASSVTLQYDRATPRVIGIRPDDGPLPWDLDAGDQTGTIDPLSAIWRVLRPRPEADLCGWQVTMFDGQRRTRLFFEEGLREGADITCRGLYQRLAGYPPADLAERSRFPFSARFSDRGGGLWVLTSVEAQSLFGTVRILERDD